MGTGAGVNPKLRSKSNNPNMNLELDPDLKLTPPKNDLTLDSYGDKNLRWQQLQKYIISNSATYVWHTQEKDTNMEFTAENGADQQ